MNLNMFVLVSKFFRNGFLYYYLMLQYGKFPRLHEFFVSPIFFSSDFIYKYTFLFCCCFSNTFSVGDAKHQCQTIQSNKQKILHLVLDRCIYFGSTHYCC